MTIALSQRSLLQTCLSHAKGETLFKDIEHLLRLAAVMLVALVAFVFLAPPSFLKSFGQYGHYRGDAIAEMAARPSPMPATSLRGCHTDVVDQKKLGRHAGLHCEVCHGPQARHADDPASVKPPLPDTAVICARCHEANCCQAHSFPQVASADHSGGLACNTCHQPHRPKIEDQAKSGDGRQKDNGHHSPPPSPPLPAAAVAWEYVQRRHARGSPPITKPPSIGGEC